MFIITATQLSSYSITVDNKSNSERLPTSNCISGRETLRNNGTSFLNGNTSFESVGLPFKNETSTLVSVNKPQHLKTNVKYQHYILYEWEGSLSLTMLHFSREFDEAIKRYIRDQPLIILGRGRAKDFHSHLFKWPNLINNVRLRGLCKCKLVLVQAHLIHTWVNSSLSWYW